MLTIILIVLPVIVLFLIIVAATRPSDFRVTRSAAILAPAGTVFEQVNNLHNWEEWSPWAKLDPNAKNSYEGPAEGVGAAFAWSGNSKVGEGRMSITKSQPNELVIFNLEFIKPFKATNTAEFTFKTNADQTIVTWSMFGKNNFMGKLMGLFINCDKMCGRLFEKGLSQMKTLAESLVAK